MACLRLLILAAVASMVAAECPNACSDAGKCSNYAAQFSTTPLYKYTVPESFDEISEAGVCNAVGGDPNSVKKDSCICFTKTERGLVTYSHTGADCSELVCPSGTAFAATPYSEKIGTNAATVVHNQYLECSGKGKCDKSTGTCECLNGYTGAACDRTSCPNDCSSRGSCLSQKQIAIDTSGVSRFSSVRYQSAWDAEKMRGCVCDEGYFGPDCSKTQCPTDVDPLGGTGSEGGKECSGRGDCDYETGTCQCYKGYKGNKCQTQASLAM